MEAGQVHNISVQVLELTQFQGVDCYVLQVDRLADWPRYSSPSPVPPTHVLAFYTASDLKLVRLETRSADGQATLLTAEDASPGLRIAALADRALPPLVLPSFPLAIGAPAASLHTECEGGDGPPRRAAGPIQPNPLSMTAEAAAPSAAESAAAGAGAVKVRFRQGTNKDPDNANGTGAAA